MSDIAVSWPLPAEPPLDLQAKFDRLDRMYVRSQDLYYRSIRDHRRLREHAGRLIDLLRFIRENRESQSFLDELAGMADRLWAQVLAHAEENSAFEARVDAHRPKPAPRPEPPHDVAEFSWDECEVTHFSHYNTPWRITWRGGEIHTLEPYPGEPYDPNTGVAVATAHGGQYRLGSGRDLLPPYWAPMCFDTRKAAEDTLAERRDTPPIPELTLFDLMEGTDA